MTALQDAAVSLSFRQEASLLSPQLGTRCSTNYSDSDINESLVFIFNILTSTELPFVGYGHWLKCGSWIVNLNSNITKDHPRKNEEQLIGKPPLSTCFRPQILSRTKWQVVGNAKSSKKSERNIFNHLWPCTSLILHQSHRITLRLKATSISNTLHHFYGTEYFFFLKLLFFMEWPKILFVFSVLFNLTKVWWDCLKYELCKHY